MFRWPRPGLRRSQAMERTTGRPLIWATAQYLSYARPPSVVDLDVWVPAAGKYNSQARVIGHVGDKEIFTVNAALGARPSEISEQWLTMPDAPPPEDCDPGEHWRGATYGLHSRIEVRVDQGTHYGGDPRRQSAGRWAFPALDPASRTVRHRCPNACNHGRPRAFGDRQRRSGQHADGNSLVNTLRIRRIVPTEWVLCDIRILGVLPAASATEAMYLFAQDGELMATASQSLIVRVRETLGDR